MNNWFCLFIIRHLTDPWDVSRCPFNTGSHDCWAISAYRECKNDRRIYHWVKSANKGTATAKEMWEYYESAKCGKENEDPGKHQRMSNKYLMGNIKYCSLMP